MIESLWYLEARGLATDQPIQHWWSKSNPDWKLTNSMQDVIAEFARRRGLNPEQLVQQWLDERIKLEAELFYQGKGDYTQAAIAERNIPTHPDDCPPGHCKLA